MHFLVSIVEEPVLYRQGNNTYVKRGGSGKIDGILLPAFHNSDSCKHLDNYARSQHTGNLSLERLLQLTLQKTHYQILPFPVEKFKKRTSPMLNEVRKKELQNDL